MAETTKELTLQNGTVVRAHVTTLDGAPLESYELAHMAGCPFRSAPLSDVLNWCFDWHEVDAVRALTREPPTLGDVLEAADTTRWRRSNLRITDKPVDASPAPDDRTVLARHLEAKFLAVRGLAREDAWGRLADTAMNWVRANTQPGAYELARRVLAVIQNEWQIETALQAAHAFSRADDSPPFGEVLRQAILTQAATIALREPGAVGGQEVTGG